VSEKKKTKPAPKRPVHVAVKSKPKPTKQKEKTSKQSVEVGEAEKKASQKKTEKDTKKSKSKSNLDDIDADFGRSVVAAACARDASSNGVAQQATAPSNKQRAGKPDDSDATDIEGVMSDAESQRKAALAPPPPLPAPAPLPTTLPLQPPTLLDLAQKRKKKKKKKDSKQDAIRTPVASLPPPALLPSSTAAVATSPSATEISVPTDPYMETEVSVQAVPDNAAQDSAADSREALAQRFVATQKELLRLQLEAKARQLARLKKQLQTKQLQSKQQVRTTRMLQSAPASVMLPPQLAAAVLPSSKIAIQRPLPRPKHMPKKNRFASKQWISTSKALEGSRRALRGVVEKHQEKVREQREKLEDAQRRRRMMNASISPQKPDDAGGSTIAHAAGSANGNFSTSGTPATRIIATPRNLAEAVALCKAAYDGGMATSITSTSFADHRQAAVPAERCAEPKPQMAPVVSTPSLEVIDLDD